MKLFYQMFCSLHSACLNLNGDSVMSKVFLRSSLCFQNMICFYFAETTFFSGADKDRCYLAYTASQIMVPFSGGRKKAVMRYTL